MRPPLSFRMRARTFASPYDEPVTRSKIFAWIVVAFTVIVLAALATDDPQWIPLPQFIFWVALLCAAEFLAISLGSTATMTMGFPIRLALALLFYRQPLVPMTIAAICAFDRDELRLAVPIHKALFNRATAALSVGAAMVPLAAAEIALRPLPIVTASLLDLVTGLGLIAVAISFERGFSIRHVLEILVPRPVGGFVISYALLTGLGTATAVAYTRIDQGEWAVAAILIPLLFARVGIIAARGQQELSERLQKQQQALLEMTQDLFEEREKERQRIAAEIHDSSLQSLAAAAYACGNALDSLRDGDAEGAAGTIATARGAVSSAISELRDSLADLRRSELREGSMSGTIEAFALQVRTLWGREIEVDNRVTREPPISVALAAFQILQEGVTNALKHSEDAPIRVQIDDDGGVLRVVVQDEGPGFEAERVDDEAHLGLRLMNERAAQVGGRIELDTAPGRGVRLVAILPGGDAL